MIAFFFQINFDVMHEVNTKVHCEETVIYEIAVFLQIFTL